MQYYLELDVPVADADFDSCAFPDASDELETMEEELGLVSHFELFSYAAQNDLCPPEHRETEIPWHDAQEGIVWLAAIIQHIRSNPVLTSKFQELLDDFTRCADILTRAKAVGAKWHFAMDI